MPGKKRSVNSDYIKFIRGSSYDTPARRELLKRIPERLQWNIGYMAFPPEKHVKALDLHETFFSSLTPDTRVLEIGSGTGRLADYLLRKSRLKPENYHMLDVAYGANMPWVKKRIAVLLKKGRITAINANMWNYKYPENTYDHILVPENFFPETAIPDNDREKLERVLTQKVVVDLLFLRRLIRKLEPALKINGSIRISYINPLMAETIKKQQLFSRFKMTITNAGLILEKRSE